MGKKLRKIVNRGITVTLSLLLVAGNLPLSAFAKETDRSYVTEGTYQYSSNEGENLQATDSFVYRDDCFMRSSYLGCTHIQTLSAQLCISTASYYGAAQDIYEKDSSDCQHNAVEMMKAMGFENVEDNTYCHTEKLENSAGVVVGSRSVSAYGKDYTLLAIAPRSAGYKQEWAGNFNVGDGNIHAGFKAARDEDLRFIKQYIENHGITGNLKVWVTGHSRGSAVANLIGGFFADGGIEYFGSDVSITPEDVYCYTFASVRTIKDGAPKNEVLSVEGARGGEYAGLDTPGEAWNYTAGGNIDIHAECYNGIHNYPFDYDFITYLPPESWGFEYYGQVLDLRKVPNAVSDEAMLSELQSMNEHCYQDAVKGDYRNFKDVTLNPGEIKNISFDEEAETKDIIEQIKSNENLFIGEVKGEQGYADVVSERLKGLTSLAATNEEYVNNGMQDTLVATAGIYGMCLLQYNNEMIGDGSVLAKPLLLGYLSYASESLVAEGCASNETEAVGIALLELIDWLTEAGIGAHDIKNLTVDEFIVIVAQYVAENKDTPLFTMIREELNKKETDSDMLLTVFHQLLVRYIDDREAKFGDALIDGLSAFVNGPGTESDYYSDFLFYHPDKNPPTAQDARYNAYYNLYNTLYLASIFMGLDVGDLSYFGDEIPDMDQRNGNGQFIDMIGSFLPLLLMDENKNKLTVSQAADQAFEKALITVEDNLFAAIEANGNPYGDQFNLDLHGHFATLRSNSDLFRNILIRLLFYREDTSFSTEYNLRKIASFLYNVQIVPPAHYNEVYLAWCKAAEKAETDEHYIEFVEKKDASCTEAGNIEYWLLHEKTGAKYFTDSKLSAELTKDKITVPAKGHVPDTAVIECRVEPTETKEGGYDETQYCKVCFAEVTRHHVTVPAKGVSKPESENTKKSSDTVIVPSKDKEKTSEDAKKKEDQSKTENKDTGEEIKEKDSEKESSIVPFKPVTDDEKKDVQDTEKAKLPLPVWFIIIGGSALLLGLIIFIIAYNTNKSGKEK